VKSVTIGGLWGDKPIDISDALERARANRGESEVKNAKRPVVTSVRCEILGNHCHLTIWSRGKNAGTIVVGADDGLQLATRLLPHGCDSVDIGGRFTRWALAHATVQREGYTITATQDDEDRNVARIALNGELEDSVRWDGDRFEGYHFGFTPIEAENEAAREALEASYREALSHMPEVE